VPSNCPFDIFNAPDKSFLLANRQRKVLPMNNTTLFRKRLFKTLPREKPRHQPKRPPLYAVLLHDDPLNGFDYVVKVLRKVFFYSWAKAFWLTLKAHCTGRSVVWKGTFEIAEVKAQQLQACGPDPARVSAGARPLDVTIEPLL
jgi:ATP-dependent Clp protease adaptor protein ClpS